MFFRQVKEVVTLAAEPNHTIENVTAEIQDHSGPVLCLRGGMQTFV